MLTFVSGWLLHCPSHLTHLPCISYPHVLRCGLTEMVSQADLHCTMTAKTQARESGRGLADSVEVERVQGLVHRGKELYAGSRGSCHCGQDSDTPFAY